MTALNELLAAVKVEANVFHNGQYCGTWAVDTSGALQISFHVVSRGKCYLQVQKQSFELNAGDVVFFPNDAQHRITNFAGSDVPANQATSHPMNDDVAEATGLVCGYLHHSHPVFGKFLKQLPEYIIVRRDQQPTSAAIVNLMLRESAHSGQSTNLLLNRLSDCLFYLLLRDHVEMDQGVLAAMVHPKLGKSLELIHRQLEEKLSLDELATQAGMSRSAFSALFKQVVGQTPLEYLTEWRMTQAYRWLTDDGISTLDAALRCGYESEAAFSKAFKRVMSIGPGEARSQVKV